MKRKNQLFDIATQLSSIAQAGKTYCRDAFCDERYDALQKIASDLYANVSGLSSEEIYQLLIGEVGYSTPKLDVRGALFKGNEILLVQEKQDHCWTLPGGWADINESASESIVREFLEETGLSVKTVKLIALLDKLKQAHPPQLPHAYKCIFLCERVDGSADEASGFESIEIADMDYFSLDKLPPLSVNRVTSTQIDLCFRHYADKSKATAYD